MLFIQLENGQNHPKNLLPIYNLLKLLKLESENLHFEIYNILKNKISIIDDALDLSETDYFLKMIIYYILFLIY